MSLTETLDKEIQNSRNGRVGTIPFCYDRVRDYIDISKNTMYVLGAETGDGKTSYVLDAFVIHPIRWYLQNKSPDIKLTVITFFMERKMYMTTARIISRLIFEDRGMRISPKRILGRKKNEQMEDWEYEIVKEYYKVIDEWERDDLLIVHEGSKNPSGISMWLEEFAKKHGTIYYKDKDDKSMENILRSKHYSPTHPNHIVLIIGDNSGILAPERDSKTGSEKGTKTLVDAFSRTMREARDIYGMSPVIVQQLSRMLSDVNRQKMGDLVPKLSDFADSSQTQRDADVVMALFNPYNHAVTEKEKHYGYDLKRLKDKYYRTYYRSLHILKNSFDSSGMAFPMSLEPVRGIFKTLPKTQDIYDGIYEEIVSGQWFIEQDEERGEKRPFAGFGRNRVH